MRHLISLDGAWQFQLDTNNSVTLKTFKPDRTVRVPAPWQAHAGLHQSSGVGWYTRTFKLSAKDVAKSQAVVLRINAADYAAAVWVNGKHVGEHEGGYLPCEFNITKAAKAGTNTVTVRVDDRLEHFAEIPHGKQSWYGPISGLWQSVSVESRPTQHITALRITPQGNSGFVAVTALLSQPRTAGDTLSYEIFAPNGKRVAQLQAQSSTVVLHVPAPKLWDVDAPNLYTARVVLGNGDAIADTFGFRTIEARDGKLWLNGQPFYMRSALDQDYYPDLIYTPPSLEYIEDQFRKAKQLGLNSLRIHIKIGDPRYYLAADKVGLLIWTEMPNWQLLTERTQVRAKDTFVGMVERDWNRPSVAIRSIINEAWGVEMHNADHRRWMSDTYDWLKQLDPTRLVVDNSACHGNFHVVSDIDDMHVYYTIPDHYQNFRAWVRDIAQRPKWTYAPNLSGAEERLKFMRDHWQANWIENTPEVRRTGNEPIIVSEFGNWGLPDVPKLLNSLGHPIPAQQTAQTNRMPKTAEPWWFETGMQHGEGQVYPHGIQDRFALYHLNRVWKDLSALAKASQNMQHLALKWELEEMRRHASIQGYVITEFTDLHWECNGLLDMARNTKTFHNTFNQINADDVILPSWQRVAFWEGERVEIGLDVSQYSARDLVGSTLTWAVAGTHLKGSVAGVAPVQADVVRAGSVAFDAPSVKRSTRAKLNLSLITKSGQVAAKNSVDLYFFPRASAKPQTLDMLYAPDAQHAAALRALGYAVVDNIDTADIVVTGRLTEALRNHLLHGGKVLWLAESDDAQQSHWGGYYGVHVGPRAGTAWSGDWASNLNWLVQDKLFKDIPTAGVVDFAFADLTPDHVIHGIHPYYYATEVHSGLFLGWIHKVVALMAERTVGKGKLFISTYRLKRHLATHPVAAILVRDMLARLSAM